MFAKRITDYFFYRSRFIVGYSLIAFLAVLMLTVSALYIPGGVSQSEVASVVQSGQLSLDIMRFKPGDIINLPYHGLQRLSFYLLGLSDFSIKLPSLILGILMLASILVLLRLWFSRNAAVIGSLITVTSSSVMLVASNGSPAIMYLFLPAIIMALAGFATRQSSLRRSAFFLMIFFAGCLLYTPLGAYILLALFAACLLHPHLRFCLRGIPKRYRIIGLLLFLITIAPIVAVSIVWDATTLLKLLGIPNNFDTVQGNFTQLASMFFNVLNPSSAMAVLTPVFGLGVLLLMLVGLVDAWRTRHTDRCYILALWLLFTLPLLVLNPQYFVITFLPAIVLATMGCEWLLRRWYGLFPNNPYARIAGLLPLGILFGGIVYSGMERYVYAYMYLAPARGSFSIDLRLLNNRLADAKKDQVSVVVAPHEQAFYQTAARYNKNMTVIDPPAVRQASTPFVLVSRDASPSVSLGRPARIITNALSNNADRFYLYNTTEK